MPTALDAASLLSELEPADRELLESHLHGRIAAWSNRADLRVVYDLLSVCNLRCAGCCVSPRYRSEDSPLPIDQLDPTKAHVLANIRVLAEFTRRHSLTCSIIFGGGEPFLRPDLEAIVGATAEAIGASNVGVDTNGSVDGQLERVGELRHLLGCVGVSIDGPKRFHDAWRGKAGSYDRAVGVISEFSSDPLLGPSLEVSSVATVENLVLLQDLVETLAGNGLRHYSVHRAMPVGRMARHSSLIPSAAQYLQLTVDLLRACSRYEIEFHMHHSIEEIYAALLLGYAPASDHLFPSLNASSSLGIDPAGVVTFDPWSMEASWRAAASGQLSPSTLERLYFDGHPDLDDLARTRCAGCTVACSGGSRIAAAVGSQTIPPRHRSPGEVLVRLRTGVDPACPLDIPLADQRAIHR